MMSGQEQPDSGSIVLGDTVKLASVDQFRDSMDGSKTVWEEVSGGQDIMRIGNTEMPSRAYVGRFNFKGVDQGKRVGELSGGERGRLHLAKLLQVGGNVLLLDEPTNDLDIETLRALENALLEFPGCAMVISHDRWFLDRIATHILDYQDEGKVEFFEGNFTEYEEYKKRTLGADALEPHRIKYKKIASNTPGAACGAFLFPRQLARVVVKRRVLQHHIDKAGQRRGIQLAARVDQIQLIALRAPRRQDFHQQLLRHHLAAEKRRQQRDPRTGDSAFTRIQQVVGGVRQRQLPTVVVVAAAQVPGRPGAVGDAAMLLQLLRVFDRRMLRQIGRRRQQIARRIPETATDQRRILRLAGAQRGVEAFLYQIHHGIGHRHLQRNVRVLALKIRRQPRHQGRPSPAGVEMRRRPLGLSRSRCSARSARSAADIIA